MYHEWCAISVIAGALERRSWLQWDRKLYPNLYVVLTSPPGAGRKGTAMRIANRFIRSLPDVSIAAKSITEARLIAAVHASKRESKIRNQNEMVTHSSTTVFSDELTVFLGYKNLEMITTLTDWYDTPEEPWDRETKTKGIFRIEGVWVNILGATTETALAEALPSKSAGIGLLSRMLFIYSNRRGKTVPIPHLMSDGNGSWVKAPKVDDDDDPTRILLTQDLHCIHEMSGEFVPSAAFLERYTEWYADHTHNGMNMFAGALASYSERRQVHLLKLSLIMCAARRNSDYVIDACDFDRALATLTHAEQFMHKSFSGFGQADNSQLMREVMATIAYAEKITFSEILMKHLNDIGSRNELVSMIETLVEVKFCKYDPVSSTITYNKKRKTELAA